MQVMASLINIMPKRMVLDWCVRGYSITAKEAHRLGLLSHICSEDKIESVTNTLFGFLVNRLNYFFRDYFFFDLPFGAEARSATESPSANLLPFLLEFP